MCSYMDRFEVWVYVPDIKRAPGVITVTTDYKTVTWGRIRSKWDISGV